MSHGGGFLAATRQHVGKTSSSLGLVTALQKVFDKIGFQKPMGQQHVPIKVEGKQEPVQIDKDCPLFKELLGCSGSYEDMSPLVVPAGYTRDYIDLSLKEQTKLRTSVLDDIAQAYKRIAAESDFVVCEGTGHTAVGSIVGLNNAKIASHLDVPMVMVVNGGIGSSFDEFYLNQCVIEAEGARLAGVLVNKCAPKKVNQVHNYLEKALAPFDVPILGVVPDKEFFESPCIRDFESLFNTKMLTGKDHRNRHFKEVRLATCSTRHFLSTYRKSSPQTLWVIHASRTDLILALKSAAQEAEHQNRHDPDYNYQGGLLLTGSPNISFPRGLQEDIFDMVTLTVNFPTMYVPQSSHQVMNTIERYTAKLNVEDVVRASAVMEHYAEHIDVELLLERCTGNQDALRGFGCPR